LAAAKQALEISTQRNNIMRIR
jgi:hypothetical protein